MTNPFIDTTKREIKRIMNNPLILVIMFVIPLSICFILNETFKDGIPKDLPIAVLDEDNSDISRKIVRMIDATPTCRVEYKTIDIKQGRDLITEGKTYAFLVIPKDFKKDLLKGVNPKIVYYYNNQMLLIGGSITKDVNLAIQTLKSEITVKSFLKQGLPKEVATSQVNLIKVDEHTLSNPYVNYSYLLSTAAFIHIFQIIITFLSIYAIGSEFKDGTTKQWLERSGNSVIVAVFSKLMPYIISFMVLIGLIYWMYFVIYGAPFNGSIIFCAFATLLFILSYQLIGMAFVAISSNLRLSFSAGAFFTSLGFTLEGMTFPNIAMPVFARFYSALLPLRPYLAIMIDQSQRGFPVKYDWNYILWLIALGCVGIVFLPLLKKKMQDENQWYKI